jgi:hypothetical protein
MSKDKEMSSFIKSFVKNDLQSAQEKLHKIVEAKINKRLEKIEKMVK